MLTIGASADGLPQVSARLSGFAVYLDNWAVIELANGNEDRRQRFVSALKNAGSLLFSLTNALELAGAAGQSADRIRMFLDELENYWIPLELNPWEVSEREVRRNFPMTPCISPEFIDAFFKGPTL